MPVLYLLKDLPTKLPLLWIFPILFFKKAAITSATKHLIAIEIKTAIVSYIICRAQCKMKTWSPESKSGNKVVFIFLISFIIFLFFYCLTTVISIFTTPIPTPHPQTSPLLLCPCVFYTCSLMALPLLTPIIPLPSGYCQFVLYLNVSGCILLACLFCWLGMSKL